MRNVGRCTAYRSCRRWAVYSNSALPCMQLCMMHLLRWWHFDGARKPAFIRRIDAQIRRDFDELMPPVKASP